MIETKCASCGKAYKLPEEAAGKKAKCKACGKVMHIPGGDDDPLGLGGVPGGGPVDLSSLYGRQEQEPIAAPPAAMGPVGFNPPSSFSNTPRRSSGPPMKLIIGGIGGVAGVLLIVVLAVVLFSGGGETEEEATDGGLTLSGGTVPPVASTPSRASETAGQSGRDTTRPRPATRPDVYGAAALYPPEEDELGDWSLQVSDVTEAPTKRVTYRGVALHLPQSWSAKEILFSESLGMGVKGEDSIVVSFCDDSGAIGVFQSKPGANSELTLIVSRRPNESDWPLVYRGEQLSAEMFFGPTIREQLGDDAGAGGNQQRVAEFLEDVIDGLIRNSLVGFEVIAPRRFFVSGAGTGEVEYGTLFGGYPFARVEGTDKSGRHQINYIGHVGGMQVILLAKTPASQAGLLVKMDRVIRTATLVEEEEIQEMASSDSIYRSWLDDPSVKLVAVSEPAPLTGLDPIEWDDSVASSPEAGPVIEGLVQPVGLDYGLVPPGDLEVLSTTRSAVRTRPLDDGYWMAMEVYKLSGLERRQVSPVSADGTSILIRGVNTPVPEGAELTELKSEHFTVYRLLYPAEDGSATRQVVYVVKDGAYLISVLGRYPADAPERLAELDAAAQSVQAVEPEDND